METTCRHCFKLTDPAGRAQVSAFANILTFVCDVSLLTETIKMVWVTLGIQQASAIQFTIGTEVTRITG